MLEPADSSALLASLAPVPTSGTSPLAPEPWGFWSNEQRRTKVEKNRKRKEKKRKEDDTNKKEKIMTKEEE